MSNHKVVYTLNFDLKKIANEKDDVYIIFVSYWLLNFLIILFK